MPQFITKNTVQFKVLNILAQTATSLTKVLNLSKLCNTESYCGFPFQLFICSESMTTETQLKSSELNAWQNLFMPKTYIVIQADVTYG
jgi:hypothetical protein